MSMLEVAKMAGCSHATVSRVVNRQTGVSEETAARVQSAVRKLGYIPPKTRRGPKPRGPRKARTGNVVVLMFRTQASSEVSPVSMTAIHAAEAALGENGYAMAITQVNGQSRLPVVLARGDFDGLLLHGAPMDQKLTERLKNYPCVWIMSPRQDHGYWGDRVAPDNEAIGRMAAEYLIGLGHRNIAFLYVE